jgi:transposase
MGKASFDVGRRERVLALVAVGFTVEQAAAAVGASTSTIARWVARGRAPGAPEAYRLFAERLDVIRAEAEEERREAVEEADPGPLIDNFTWLEPDRMGELTEEEQQRARRVFCEANDPRPPRFTAAEWKLERARILRGERDWRPA